MLNQNPEINFYRQNIEVQNKNIMVNKKAYLPDFNVGYFNQQIEGIQGMQGFSIGVNVPLFYRNIKANVNASKIDSKIAESKLNDFQLHLKNLLQLRVNNYNRHHLEVQYYNSTGSVLAMQLTDFSTKAYQQGEINYIEYLGNINQATLIKRKYLDSLKAQNSEVIEILYLIGK